MQELVLVTKQRDRLKERISALSQSTPACPDFAVYPNTTVTAAAAAPYPAFVPVPVVASTPAPSSPFSQPKPTPSAPYSLPRPTKAVPATSTSPLGSSNAFSVPNQYPVPAVASTPSATTVTTTMPARGLPRGPATLHTVPSSQLHKATPTGALPPINTSANAPVYPTGGASGGTYSTQTPAKGPDSSAIPWKCQICNTSNTKNVCNGCSMPRPSVQNTPPTSPTRPPASTHVVWMFAAVGTEIFCPYALDIQALLEQQYWKTKSLPAVTLHALQLGPDAMYEIRRQQNLLFQVRSSNRDPYPRRH